MCTSNDKFYDKRAAPRAGGAENIAKCLEVLDARALDAHAVGHLHPIEPGPREIEELLGSAPRLRADRRELALEDLVYPIGEDAVHDIAPFARLGPERLQQIHAGAVRLEAHHLAIGARDRS